MSFVTTRPEALTAVAGALQTLGSSMSAQNAAAAAPTADVVPAAADEVSVLQATLFSAYGSWYQQVSAQAAAIHQMLVSTLGISAGSYGDTESTNQTATSAASLPGLVSSLLGGSGLSNSSGATLGTPIEWGQNFSAAASDLVQVAPAHASSSSSATGLTGDVGAGLPAGAPAPAVGAVTAGPPVLASSGQASSVGGLSVPPGWAAAGVAPAGTTSGTLTGAGWTSAAPPATHVTAMSTGMPAMASAGRGGLGLGAPRYGAKPTVMPKPTVV